MKSQTLKALIILATLASGFAAQAIPSIGKPATPELREEQNPLKHNINAYEDRDTRADLSDTKHPWSTIGRLSSPTGGLCSATMIGPDLILTAAHCILDKDGNLKKGQYKFQAGYYRGKVIAEAGAIRAWWGSRQGHYTDNDWAIMQLNARLGDRLGWMGVRSTTSEDLVTLNHMLYLAAYGSDYKDMELPYWQRGCKFRSRVEGVEYVLHDCSSSRGSSGGSMFVWDATKSGYYVVAVNVAERRKGEVSERLPTYTHEKANIAIPTYRFFSTFVNLLDNQTGR